MTDRAFYLPYPDPPKGPLATLDPRGAAALALAEYLRCAQFRRWGGNAPDTFFRLNAVQEEWPEPSVLLDYPAASIIDQGDTVMGASDFVPRALESTRDLFGKDTVLWKLHEAQMTFQVDFFTDDAPTREAIAAALPRLFSPALDTRTGVILCGPPHYYKRPIRATLLRYRRMDDAGSVYPRERRLMAIVRAEVDVVDLRCAITLQPRVAIHAIGTDVIIPQVPESPVPPDC